MKTKLAMWKCEKCGRVWKQQSSMKRFNSGMMICGWTYCSGIALLVREGCWKKVVDTFKGEETMGRPKLKKQKWQKYPFETIEVGETFLISGLYNCDTAQDKQRAQKATGRKFKSASVQKPEAGTLITRTA